jgi:hypothetical protein
MPIKSRKSGSRRSLSSRVKLEKVAPGLLEQIELAPRDLLLAILRIIKASLKRIDLSFGALRGLGPRKRFVVLLYLPL